MKCVFGLTAAAVLLTTHFAIGARTEEQPVVLRDVRLLPKALDQNFEFRKTKLFLMTEEAPQTKQSAKNKNRGGAGDFSTARAPTTAEAAAITFQRQYRLFGAVTKLDTSRKLYHSDGMRKFGGHSLIQVEGETIGTLDLITISGDSAKVETVQGGFDGPVSLVQVGDVAYVLDDPLRFLVNPDFAKKVGPPVRAIPVKLPAAQ